MQDGQGWAFEEFGDAQLGDARRVRRLVRLADEVSRFPSGTVTGACRTSASCEGAFRLLENSAVRSEALGAAAQQAAARRCAGYTQVIVPVDGSSLTLTDTRCRKGLGAVGSWSAGGRGIHAISALAVAPDGTPLGLCAQRPWVRKRRAKSSHKHGGRIETSESEVRHWGDTIAMAQENLAREAPGCVAWYQIDRGGDCWQVLDLAQQNDWLITIRATHDRRVEHAAGRLWKAVQSAPVRARRTIQVRAKPARYTRKRVGGKVRFRLGRPQKAHSARLEIRAARVPLRLTKPSGKTWVVEVNAVLVQEMGRGINRIEWMLLTTHSIATRKDVLRVVNSYALRWRIEDFHRTWKRGLCHVEDTQLRSREAVLKWATILASVATRAMRLSQLARTSPDVPATDELSAYELEALVVLRKPKAYVKGTIPTLAQAVRWMAELGGYIRPANGPPGPTVIGRGLYDVLITAQAFEARDKMR